MCYSAHLRNFYCAYFTFCAYYLRGRERALEPQAATERSRLKGARDREDALTAPDDSLETQVMGKGMPEKRLNAIKKKKKSIHTSIFQGFEGLNSHRKLHIL